MARNGSTPVDLDDRVIRSFWIHARYFIDRLGEPRREKNKLCFPVQNLPFRQFTIRCEVERKFLGKIYVMIVEGCCPASEIPGLQGDIELRYSGFFKKKKPHFVSLSSGQKTIQDQGLSQRLNRDETLLDACHRLEIESLKVVYDPSRGALIIQVRPFGGSYVHLLLPPMRYPVLLPKGQAELIFSVMHQIAREIVRPAG